MKRRAFLKSSLAAGTAFCIIPSLAFQNNQHQLPYDELIGKGQPELFGNSYKLRKAAHEAFLDMKSEAFKSDIHIEVVSSYRSFSHQNRIWERKYSHNLNKGLTPLESIKKIIKYSTIPGTSRHHWGTDIDIIDGNTKQPSSVLQPRHFETDGCYSNLKTWMDAHANNYGFYLSYTNQSNRKGFKYEPWHYSFKPLAKAYLKQYKLLDIKSIVKQEKLLGYENFNDDFISNYLKNNILDINPELL